MHCQPLPCRLHARLKLTPFVTKALLHQSVRGLISLKTVNSKLKFALVTIHEGNHCKAVTAFLVRLDFNMGVLSVLPSLSHDF